MREESVGKRETWRYERGCNRELRGEVAEVDSSSSEGVKGVLKVGMEGERTLLVVVAVGGRVLHV